MNYIFTSCDNNFVPFLFDFVVSLNELGKFNGTVFIFYYYNENENLTSLKKLFDYSNVEWVFFPKKDKFYMTNLHIDLNEFINELEDDCCIAKYDNDIWFQSEINSLFEVNNNSIYGAPEIFLEGHQYQTNNILKMINYDEYGSFSTLFIQEKMKIIANKFGNYINGGFFCGSKIAIKRLLANMNGIFYDDRNENVRFITGSDQIVLNLSLDLGIDNGNSYLYNYCLIEPNISMMNKNNGKFYLGNEEVKALHLVWEDKFNDNFRRKYQFRYLYPSIFLNQFDKLNKTQQKIVDMKRASSIRF
jgi:hypothetical protein